VISASAWVGLLRRVPEVRDSLPWRGRGSIHTLGVLRECDCSEHAAWFEERKKLLSDSDARSELNSVVFGMGGLMDLSLTPEPGSAFTPTSARECLDALGDDLYRLTG
jgi:hypothetical protein